MDWNTPHTSIFHEPDGKPNRETGGNDLWTGGLSWISIFVLIHWRVYKSIGLSSFSQYFEMVIRRGRCPIFRRTSLEAGQKPMVFPRMPAYLGVNRLVLGFLTDPHLIKLGLLVLTHRHNLFI